VGYVLSFLVFFFGTLFTGGNFGDAWMPILGWIIVLSIVAIFSVLIIRKNNELKKEAEKRA
jgi:amino acid transporter